MHRAHLASFIVLAALTATSALAQSFVDSDLDGSSGIPHQKAQGRRERFGATSQTQDGYTIPQVLHQSSTFDVGGPRHSSGSRKGRTASDSILDRGICIGC